MVAHICNLIAWEGEAQDGQFAVSKVYSEEKNRQTKKQNKQKP